MSDTFNVSSPRELQSLIERHAKNRMRKVVAATKKAAKAGRNIVRGKVPVAFDELRTSVHDEGSRVIVDAPHAAAVNLGSRPHWVPLEALVKWVKLRGMQGLTKSGRLAKSPRGAGSTTAGHARRVAGELKARERGKSLDVDAPLEIARAIQLAIASYGTKPHHFIEKSLPDIRAVLGIELKAAIDSSPE